MSRVGLVIGVDAGGTTTRCRLSDPAGRRLGDGRAPGINQHSSGGDRTDHLATAIRQALGAYSPSTVGAGVLAVAGAGEAGLATVRRDAEQVWRTLGLGGRPAVLPDVVATFAAGTTADEGSALIAGTGAIAAAVREDDLVATADGYGWLLGDVGSAVWLGREGVAAVLAALDGRARNTGLRAPFLAALDSATAQDVVGAVYSAAPAELGRLAPIVAEQACAADETAVDIVRRGVDGLLRSFDAVRRKVDGPTVLGGALLTTTGPVRDGVVRGLDERQLSDVTTASDPALGATRLALRQLAR